ncbi:MAG: ubiquinol-cytochrome c reductase iron-sulfur subunit [Deltaproteobacteria bacterium]|nr:MAG: ubiquinol-cytochrome c reductase iron-sulfur subunit [Deltaproteobacteria bacterium]
MAHETTGTSRRGFLKAATVAIGGAIGAVFAIPVIRYVLYPLGRRIVTSASDPVDVGPADQVKPGGPPVRVSIVAPSVRDGWTVRRDVALGAAWLVRDADGTLRALSTVCPHLGCAVDYDADAGRFACPCHASSFARDGGRLGGPAKRGLDPLPVEEADGRVRVAFRRYRSDTPDREEV